MKHFFKLLSFSILLIFSFSLANTTPTIKVNNKYIETDVDPFIKNGTTYVPIRFVADALKVDSVTWNQNSKSITIKNGKDTILMFANKNYAYINDDYTTLDNNIIISNNRTFVPLRFISEALNSNVKWDNDTYTVSITNKNDTIDTTNSSNNLASSITSYTEDELYWLSRIIDAEAGGEPFSGKVAVGEVILNRVKSNEFPDTIWGVIFDDKFGIQFEPVSNGTIYNTPSDDSIKAAKAALNGSNYIGDCLYFLNPSIASSNWIIKNRDFYTTIANHDFYA